MYISTLVNHCVLVISQNHEYFDLLKRSASQYHSDFIVHLERCGLFIVFSINIMFMRNHAGVHRHVFFVYIFTRFTLNFCGLC